MGINLMATVWHLLLSLDTKYLAYVATQTALSKVL